MIRNEEVFTQPFSIPDIINSLFLWKETFSRTEHSAIEESLDKSISELLPVNDLLIEQSGVEIKEGGQ